MSQELKQGVEKQRIVPLLLLLIFVLDFGPYPEVPPSQEDVGQDLLALLHYFFNPLFF